MTTPIVRSDVRRNRRAILDAARELFAREHDVPMYKIAKHAGVGQATLYRHFPDRSTLAAAIALDALEEIEAASEPTQTLEHLLTTMAESSARTPGLRRMMSEGDGARALEETRVRLTKLFDAPLREAKRAGRVDGRITKNDLLLLLQMLEGGLDNATADDLERRRRLSPRALRLALAALRPE